MEQQILEWAKKVVDLGEKYIPLYVQQYLSWWTAVHLGWMIVSVLFLGIFTLIFIVDRNKFDSFEDQYDDPRFANLAPLFVWVSMIPVLIGNAFYYAKIKIAPAVYIIDSIK